MIRVKNPHFPNEAMNIGVTNNQYYNHILKNYNYNSTKRMFVPKKH